MSRFIGSGMNSVMQHLVAILYGPHEYRMEHITVFILLLYIANQWEWCISVIKS